MVAFKLIKCASQLNLVPEIFLSRNRPSVYTFDADNHPLTFSSCPFPLKIQATMSGGKKAGSGGGNGANGFKALGLSESVYHGIVRMGFRVRLSTLFFFENDFNC